MLHGFLAFHSDPERFLYDLSVSQIQKGNTQKIKKRLQLSLQASF
jgi:hypothetical protein